MSNSNGFSVSPSGYRKRHNRLSNSTKGINRLSARRGGIKL